VKPSFSPKDRGVIRELFEAVFPNIEVEHSYSYGSNDMIAPIMNSLMLSFANVAIRLNEVLTLFKKIIPKAKELMIDVEWIDTLSSLQDWHAVIRSIPMQKGCDGTCCRGSACVPASDWWRCDGALHASSDPTACLAWCHRCVNRAPWCDWCSGEE
jgi:hypothetical protein